MLCLYRCAADTRHGTGMEDCESYRNEQGGAWKAYKHLLICLNPCRHCLPGSLDPYLLQHQAVLYLHTEIELIHRKEKLYMGDSYGVQKHKMAPPGVKHLLDRFTTGESSPHSPLFLTCGVKLTARQAKSRRLLIVEHRKLTR